MEFLLATPEQRRKISLDWYVTIRPHLYSNWPDEYKKLSFKTIIVEITKEENRCLLDCFSGGFSEKISKTDMPVKFNQAIHNLGGSAFVKLETRSPKDNYFSEIINLRRCSWRDVSESLYSERILDDLVRYEYLDAEPLRILFREWFFIPKYEEFRCFINKNKISGISQYFYKVSDADDTTIVFHSKKIIKGAKFIERKIIDFLNEKIIPHMSIDSSVIDLWFDKYETIHLIETNPYGLSDPCLMSYEEMNKTDFYEFRFNK